MTCRSCFEAFLYGVHPSIATEHKGHCSGSEAGPTLCLSDTYRGRPSGQEVNATPTAESETVAYQEGATDWKVFDENAIEILEKGVGRGKGRLS